MLTTEDAAARLPAPTAGGPNPQIVEDLAYGNRILADQGILDAYGHVSVRHDKNPGHFLLARNMAPALVKPSDILEYDKDGEPVNLGNRRVYLERFIHAAIYRARPDVISVVHSHSSSVIPLGVTGSNLRAIYHMAGFLGTSTPIFEIRDFAGNTDLLIRDNKLGDALASVLADRPAALMRGHGSVVVGTSIQQAVWRAFFLEQNAKLQLESMKIGSVNFLNAEEAALAGNMGDSQIVRPWELWKKRIGKIE